MPAAADVCCAHTYVRIGQLSRTDAFSTYLTVLLCVGVSALHSRLLTFSSPLPPLALPQERSLLRWWDSSQIQWKTWALDAYENGEDGKEPMMQFQKPFFLARKWGLQGACRWSLMFHMGPVIIPSSPMAWACNSSIVRSLSAHYDPWRRQMGHLQISCGDPNKVFDSVF